MDLLVAELSPGGVKEASGRHEERRLGPLGTGSPRGPPTRRVVTLLDEVKARSQILASTEFI